MHHYYICIKSLFVSLVKVQLYLCSMSFFFSFSLTTCSFSFALPSVPWKGQLNNSLLLRVEGELGRPIGLSGHNKPI